MGTLHSCKLVEVNGDELTVDVALTHVDSSLPTPDDHPSIARLLAGESGEWIADGAIDDAVITSRASSLVAEAEIVAVSDIFTDHPKATYRVRLTDEGRARWKRTAGAEWEASGIIAHIFDSASVKPISFAAINRLTFGDKKAKGTQAEQVQAIGELLRTRPYGPFENLVDAVPSHGEAAAPLFVDLVRVQGDAPPEVAVALGHIGDLRAIPVLLLMLVNNRDVGMFRFRPRTEALIALGWFGESARELAESTLREFVPKLRERAVAHDFALWRVLGDQEAFERFRRVIPHDRGQSGFALKYDDDVDLERHNEIGAVRLAVLEAPTRVLPELVEATRDELLEAGVVRSPPQKASLVRNGFDPKTLRRSQADV